MAIVDINLADRSAGYDQNGVFKASQTWDFTIDSSTDDEGTVLAQFATDRGVAIGTAHPSAALTFVTSIEVEQAGGGDWVQWTGKIEWGPWQERELNPLDEPYEMDWGNETRQILIDFDVNGDPIVNSAGDPFLSGVTRDSHPRTLTITRNELTFDPAIADTYQDTVNTDIFFGAAAGTVVCDSITATRQWNQNVPGGFYYKVQYRFRGLRDGWKVRLLDQGMRYISGGARKQVYIQGEPASEPVPLDGAGAVLAVGGTPVVLEFDVYPGAAFAAFLF